MEINQVIDQVSDVLYVLKTKLNSGIFDFDECDDHYKNGMLDYAYNLIAYIIVNSTGQEVNVDDVSEFFDGFEDDDMKRIKEYSSYFVTQISKGLQLKDFRTFTCKHGQTTQVSCALFSTAKTAKSGSSKSTSESRSVLKDNKLETKSFKASTSETDEYKFSEFGVIVDDKTGVQSVQAP